MTRNHVLYGALTGALLIVLTNPAARALINPPTPVQAPAKAQGAPGTPPPPDCNTTPISPTRASDGYFVRAPSDNLQHKTWQPRGGDIPFTIHLTQNFDNDTAVRVCVRWHLDGAKQQDFIEASARIDSIAASKQEVTIVATVPPLESSPPRWEWSRDLFGSDKGQALGSYTGLALVPVADLRVLLIDKSGAVKADVITAIGITQQWWAALLALASVAAVFFALTTFCKLYSPNIVAANPVLRVISTAKGFASLSQFQILLWTFVIGAAVIYVMTLSGNLIKLTTGTLVLLGISAAATLGSQLQSKQEDQRTAKADAAKAAAPAIAAAPPAPAAPAPAAVAAAPIVQDDKIDTPHTPTWCDLVYDKGEIDVTRVQMLYFTVVAAAYVAMTVINTFEIPEIPESFLVLMGISNGVYITAKYNK